MLIAVQRVRKNFHKLEKVDKSGKEIEIEQEIEKQTNKGNISYECV